MMLNIVTDTTKLMANKNELDNAQGQRAIEAIVRLQELSKNKILSSNDEAEKNGLRSFIESTVFQHADELLACWHAVRREYEPFVLSLSNVLGRCSVIRRQQMTSQVGDAVQQEGKNFEDLSPEDKAARIQEEVKAGNVVQLNADKANV